MTTTIKNWLPNERPREKLLLHGAKELSDAELLAIFIRNGVRGKTAIDLARELLQKFGNLRCLLDASEKEFCAGIGLGKAKYAELKAALEISQRYLMVTITREHIVNNAKAAELYLTAKLRNAAREIFACLFLDNCNRVICYEELFVGSISSAAVYPREVLKKALQHNAASVILAHNHTSGNPTPSLADKQITQQLKKSLGLIDIKVLDHIIIGEGEFISLAELGMI